MVIDNVGVIEPLTSCVATPSECMTYWVNDGNAVEQAPDIHFILLPSPA